MSCKCLGLQSDALSGRVPPPLLRSSRQSAAAAEIQLMSDADHVDVVMQMSGPLERRSEQDMFYSCPSTSAVAFFQAVSSCCHTAALEQSTFANNPGQQLREVVEVIQAVKVCLCPTTLCC